MISAHLETFAGLPTAEVDPRTTAVPPDSAIRLALDWDAYEDGTRLEALIEALVDRPEAARIRALVIGAWDFESSTDSSELIAALVGAADRLPELRALFIGDIEGEEQELSWIKQADITPILRGFPRLERLHVRGGDGLTLQPVDHAELLEFVVQTGGLPSALPEALGASRLPALQLLELWIGERNYGRTTDLGTLAGILGGEGLPALRRLGLRNAENAGEFAAVLPAAPVVARLSELDLSLGTLVDDDLSPWRGDARLTRLERIDLGENYLSAALLAELRASGLAISGEPQRTPDEYNGKIYRVVVHGE